jgi:hypothetical protein
LVSFGYATDGGLRLGQWVSSQRNLSAQGRLPDERQARLEAIDGWVWDVSEFAWERGCTALRRYVAEHGHTFVPAKYVTDDDYRLGNWVRHQREFYRSGTLAADRVKDLESVDAWVWRR